MKLFRYEIDGENEFFRSLYSVINENKYDELDEIAVYLNDELPCPDEWIDLYNACYFFTEKGFNYFKETMDELINMVKEEGYKITLSTLDIENINDAIYDDDLQVAFDRDADEFDYIKAKLIKNFL